MPCTLTVTLTLSNTCTSTGSGSRALYTCHAISSDLKHIHTYHCCTELVCAPLCVCVLMHWIALGTGGVRSLTSTSLKFPLTHTIRSNGSKQIEGGGNVEE